MIIYNTKYKGKILFSMSILQEKYAPELSRIQKSFYKQQFEQIDDNQINNQIEDNQIEDKKDKDKMAMIPVKIFDVYKIKKGK